MWIYARMIQLKIIWVLYCMIIFYLNKTSANHDFDNFFNKRADKPKFKKKKTYAGSFTTKFVTNNIEIDDSNNNLVSLYFKDHVLAHYYLSLCMIDKYKYSKIALTNLSSNIICSGVDIFNFTKLPYQYENQYFYTYILALYQKMFLRKINIEIKNIEAFNRIRTKFIKFTKEIWEKEVTSDDTGNNYYKTLKTTLEIDDLYTEVEKKYEIMYKDLNIDKSNAYSSIIIILLIYSLILNTINIVYMMYLLA